MLQATPADFYHWEGMQPGIWGSMQDIAGAPFEAEPERYARLSLRNYIADFLVVFGNIGKTGNVYRNVFSNRFINCFRGKVLTNNGASNSNISKRGCCAVCTIQVFTI